MNLGSCEIDIGLPSSYPRQIGAECPAKGSGKGSNVYACVNDVNVNETYWCSFFYQAKPNTCAQHGLDYTHTHTRTQAEPPPTIAYTLNMLLNKWARPSF